MSRPFVLFLTVLAVYVGMVLGFLLSDFNPAVPEIYDAPLPSDGVVLPPSQHRPKTTIRQTRVVSACQQETVAPACSMKDQG